jgi:hypothetical protein
LAQSFAIIMTFGEYLESEKTIEYKESRQEKIKRWLKIKFRKKLFRIGALVNFIDQDLRAFGIVKDDLNDIFEAAKDQQW